MPQRARGVRAGMRAWLLLAAAVLAAVAVAEAYASASPSGQVLRPIAAVLVNESLGLGEAQAPLQPLTSISCGDAVAVVYGPGAGKPLVIVVYGAGPGALSDAATCPGRLAPCLTAAGHPEAVEALRRALARAAAKTGNTTASTTMTTVAGVRAATVTPMHGAGAAAATATAAPAAGTLEGLATRVQAGAPDAGESRPGGLAARLAAVLLPAAAAAGVALLWARRS